ncbi:glycosyltransferase family 4 protein [bacterium]|nr:glycosyltransferase family 4 protein [bacterium]
MNIAFVIQRYGKEVMGGAELYCRLIAQKLAQTGHEITVYTTTAKDYITWKNEYSPGETFLDKVRIKRYPVEIERNIQSFNQYSEWIFSHDHTHEEEIEWLKQQGPYCPSLIQALQEEEPNYDFFFFFTYLYYPTYWGLRSVHKNKALLPAAHDEPPLSLSVMKEVFSYPQAVVFNTPAEKDMLNSRFNLENKYQDIMGLGVEIPERTEKARFREKYRIFSPYLLYAGRIEKGKGCEELVRYFIEFNRECPGMILVLIGTLLMELPSHPYIQYLGFLPPEEKNAALASAVVTVHPSPYESLCMAALESLAVRTPILVQEKTLPLKNHCLQGNSGLWYSHYEEFRAALHIFLQNSRLRKKLGDNGLDYVRKHYAWPQVIERYSRLFRHLTSSYK